MSYSVDDVLNAFRSGSVPKTRELLLELASSRDLKYWRNYRRLSKKSYALLDGCAKGVGFTGGFDDVLKEKQPIFSDFDAQQGEDTSIPQSSFSAEQTEFKTAVPEINREASGFSSDSLEPERFVQESIHEKKSAKQGEVKREKQTKLQPPPNKELKTPLFTNLNLTPSGLKQSLVLGPLLDRPRYLDF